MLDVLKQQYWLISSTRETLFTFLEEISFEDLHRPIPNFGSGDMIRTHIHVADCYRYWLGSFAFKQKRSEFSFATDFEIENSDVQKVRDRFKMADEVVEKFLEEFNSRWFEPVTNEVAWQAEPWSTTPLWLLTHTETHEFHHKGQIVSMARHLGYNPPETDLKELVL